MGYHGAMKAKILVGLGVILMLLSAQVRPQGEPESQSLLSTLQSAVESAVKSVSLRLPAGLTAPQGDPAAQAQSVPYQEYRVGGRLEQVTVTRENGVTEIYRNDRTDTLWSAAEEQIGEVPNMRQWVIGTW